MRVPHSARPDVRQRAGGEPSDAAGATDRETMMLTTVLAQTAIAMAAIRMRTI